jgi:hypothetical protein
VAWTGAAWTGGARNERDRDGRRAWPGRAWPRGAAPGRGVAGTGVARMDVATRGGAREGRDGDERVRSRRKTWCGLPSVALVKAGNGPPPISQKGRPEMECARLKRGGWRSRAANRRGGG